MNISKSLLVRSLPATGFAFVALAALAIPVIAQQTAPLGPRIGALPPAPPPAPEVELPQSEAVQADISEVSLDAIVRVEVDTKQPNYRVPWNIGGMSSGNGTGFLVGPNKFLTNAHVVSNGRLIYIKKVNDPKPYKARVVHVAHDCDLAMIEVESEDEFMSAFSGVEPLFIGGIPKLNPTVVAIGYPIGGERISVTRGVVSRIDFRTYSHSSIDNHLTIQVDAAINPGNSGGPVLQNNQVVGVAFQGYSGSVAQNTGYMIPVPVIERFLKDVEDGSYDFYVDLATSVLNILNPAPRRALGLPNDGIGVMVSDADAAGSAGGILKTNDVLLSIDGHPNASDGFIENEGERVDLNEIIERKYAGDTVDLEVWRDQKKEEITIELKRFIPYLIQANQYDNQPNFVLFAGLQFQPMDRSVMGSHSITNLRTRYHFNYFSQDEIYKERPQVVILTEVLPDSSNTHLQPFVQQIVDTINGKKIRLLQDVYDALHSDAAEEGHEDYHVIRLLGEGRPLVLKRDSAEEAHERIMSKYNVSVDHFIEEPEILELEGIGIFEEAEEEAGADETSESDEPEADDAKEAA